jgi:hypothetical protein
MAALKLRIDAQGNVGIGTLAPLHRVHVGGCNVNVDAGRSYRINNVPVQNSTALGNSVVSPTGKIRMWCGARPNPRPIPRSTRFLGGTTSRKTRPIPRAFPANKQILMSAY